MIRTDSAAFLNRVVNDPSVRPHVGGGEGVLDLGPLLDDRRNVALVNDHGGLIYVWREPHTYEVHTMLLPEGRGAGAVLAARESLRFMFTSTDCLEVLTRCPPGNKGALGLTRAVGFWRSFETAAGSFWTLPFDRWRASDPTQRPLSHLLP